MDERGPSRGEGKYPVKLPVAQAQLAPSRAHARGKTKTETCAEPDLRPRQT
ncbi:hypothetical protein [Actinokineospora terrae]|uniref:hypothetical protein n=1 Tax=Actinokineospora terrae TaxID=155974 RepID=UPI0015A56F31|nr:hypothetical protein [Actinokineospora terrae]